MPTLFDPVQAGDLHLKNRIVMAPLTRNRSPDAIPRDITATYYAQRAGAGRTDRRQRRMRMLGASPLSAPASSR